MAQTRGVSAASGLQPQDCLWRFCIWVGVGAALPWVSGRPRSWVGAGRKRLMAGPGIPPLPRPSPRPLSIWPAAPPLPQDKGPSVCSRPGQTASLSLPFPLERSASTMTSPRTLQRAWHAPCCMTSSECSRDKGWQAGCRRGYCLPGSALSWPPGLRPAEVGVGHSWRQGPAQVDLTSPRCLLPDKGCSCLGLVPGGFSCSFLNRLTALT